METSEHALLLLLLVKRNKKCRQNRKMHVHPLLLERSSKGLYHTLYEDLRGDDKMFFRYFRMSKNSFDELLENVRCKITKRDTMMRKSIAPEERLALTLRYVQYICSMVLCLCVTA